MQTDSAREARIAELKFSARKASREARKAIFTEFESLRSYDEAGKLAYETGDLRRAMDYFYKGGYFSAAKTIAAHLGDKETVERLEKCGPDKEALAKEVRYRLEPGSGFGMARMTVDYKIDLPPREKFEASLTFMHGPRKNGSPRKEKKVDIIPVYRCERKEGDTTKHVVNYLGNESSVDWGNFEDDAIVIAKRVHGPTFRFEALGENVSKGELARNPHEYIILVGPKADIGEAKEIRFERDVDLDVARHVGDSEGSTAVKNYWKMAELGHKMIGLEALPEDAWKAIVDSMLYLEADGDDPCIKVEVRACREPREEENEDEDEDEPGHRTEFPAEWVKEKLQYYVKLGGTAVRAVQMAAERLYAADFDMEEFKQALRNDPEHPELKNLSFTHSAHEIVKFAATLAFEDFCFDKGNCFRGFEKVTQFLEMAIPNEVANYDFRTDKRPGTYDRRNDEDHSNMINEAQSNFMELHPHTAEICDECNFERWVKKDEARKRGPQKVERPWGGKAPPDELYEAVKMLERAHFSNPGCRYELEEKIKRAAKEMKKLIKQKVIPGGFVDPVVETSNKLEWMEKQAEKSRAKGSA